MISSSRRSEDVTTVGLPSTGMHPHHGAGTSSCSWPTPILKDRMEIEPRVIFSVKNWKRLNFFQEAVFQSVLDLLRD